MPTTLKSFIQITAKASGNLSDALAFIDRLRPGSLFHLDIAWSWSDLRAIAET